MAYKKQIKRALFWILGPPVLVLTVLYVWWAVLSFTFDPDEDLHPINEWYVIQAHHALAPVGEFGGYDEAAYSVRRMYDAAPGDTVVTERPVLVEGYTSYPEEGCKTEQIWFPPPDEWSVGSAVSYIHTLIRHRDDYAGWLGGTRTGCHEETVKQREDEPDETRITRTDRVEVDIRWPRHAMIWLPLYPLPVVVPVEEGLLYKAAQADDDINFYTRVNYYTRELSPSEIDDK